MIQAQNSQFQTLRTIDGLSSGVYQQTESPADISVPKHMQAMLTVFDVTFKDTT